MVQSLPLDVFVNNFAVIITTNWGKRNLTPFLFAELTYNIIMERLQKSAVFDTDEKYMSHLRNTIAMLQGIVERDEDVMVEGPMATRILLDFYYETLRRTIEYVGSKERE